MASEAAALPASLAPVVVLSNRLPFTIGRTATGFESQISSGGLVSALEPALRARGGTWIGWPGIDLRAGESIPLPEAPYETVALGLSEREITHYVHGFSNRTLWPVMHSLPARARFERTDFEVYSEVNDRFADAAAQAAHGDELVWIHDYHLMLTPAMLRGRVPGARIAFFHHVPFPPYDIFRLLPWDRELLRGLLACDLIGFHVKGYADNFLDCVEKRLGSRVDRRTMVVEHGRRTIQVGVFPIGIEYGDYEQRAEAVRERPNPAGERIVLGLDRLDYTKGIPERIRSFERLLELHPEHREQVTLLQLAVPSRSQVADYRDLKREIDELVGRVNGRFASSNWSPIRYLFRSFDSDELAALYRHADVALVTPLRDGMNLVAKEFVASQVAEPGVLILSRMAGAAETMREALLVNPYNIDETAEAIHRAITMDESERSSRLAALRKRERHHDVSHWVGSFLQAASRQQAHLSPISDSEFGGWLGPFLSRPRLALFLDYDGTLAELCSHPAQARMSGAMREALECCAGREDVDIAIISGRSLDDVRQIADMKNLIYAGNHGLEIEGPGIERFHHEDLLHFRDRTLELEKALEEVHQNGAWTEAKGA
ncbi:MAG: bifunctional alpha,alpha-trehalose-phosphate synthase (UDP-forming)/trehalose-phosphatase, partial [bacterium]|nr:bifunctional alpha,alpha-trehalose-phosphate synthase (UDP-forming)/trehalose-phosphatase [bacterium]